MSRIQSTRLRTALICTAAGFTASLAGEVMAQSLALEEIVVTARKRDERLQDVPISITPCRWLG
jgi:outer membrane receptor protein involved in Fe transport